MALTACTSNDCGSCEHHTTSKHAEPTKKTSPELRSDRTVARQKEFRERAREIAHMLVVRVHDNSRHVSQHVSEPAYNFFS